MWLWNYDKRLAYRPFHGRKFSCFSSLKCELHYAVFVEQDILTYCFPVLHEFFFETANIILPYLPSTRLVQAGVVQREVDARFESSVNDPDSVGS